MKQTKWIPTVLASLILTFAAADGMAAPKKPAKPQPKKTTVKVPVQRPPRKTVLIAGSWSGYRVQRAVGDQFQKDKRIAVGVQGIRNEDGFAQLAAGKMDVLMYSSATANEEAKLLAKSFPDPDKEPARYLFGQFVVHVVVSPENRIKKLTLEQLKDIYSGKITDWKQLRGRPGKIVLVGEKRGTKSMQIFQNVVMGGRSTAYTMKACKNYAEVCQHVAKDRNAIGFFLYQQVKGKGVASVALANKGSQEPFIAPTETAIFEEQYPLKEELVLYCPAGAKPEAKQYCEYACSLAAAELIKQWYLYPACAKQLYWQKQRLEMMKDGKGVKISCVGCKSGRDVLNALAEGFVKSRAVIQLKYSTCNERTAAGRFVKESQRRVAGKGPTPTGPEFWVVDGELDARTRKAFQADLAQCKPIVKVLGNRGVAVIVNPANKLDSLTKQQIARIFKGEIKNWNDFGAIFKSKQAGIVCYAPKTTGDAEVKTFHQDVLEAACRPNIQYCKEASSVVSSVAANPSSIGIINLGELVNARNQSTVKLLGVGPQGSAIVPTVKNLLAGKYPFTRCISLYISPKAGKMTDDFLSYVFSDKAVAICNQANLISPKAKILIACNLTEKPAPAPKKPAAKKTKPNAKGRGKKTRGKTKKGDLPKWEKEKPKPEAQKEAPQEQPKKKQPVKGW